MRNGKCARFCWSSGSTRNLPQARSRSTRMREGIAALGVERGLRAECRAFEGIHLLPECSLVFSSMSLPFCPGDAFPRLWSAIETALVPGGWIAVNFLGPRNTWVESRKLIGHSTEQISALLEAFDPRWWEEKEWDAPSVGGPLKHWHVHSIIAQKAGHEKKCLKVKDSHL
jgi:hypothetical protein